MAQIANHHGRMVRWDTGKSFFWTTTEFHSVSVKIVHFKKKTLKKNLFGIRSSFQELILILWILISEATFREIFETSLLCQC